ncbi:MAG TPA: MFS transporter [Xanthobacteraceae bacterium]|jgi:AAHS family 4-hydroxybenzoate transporter-like MFS transporter
MSQAIVDVSEVLDRQKITRFNIGLVILAFLVLMTDGYDLGAAAFAGPGLIKEWGLRGPELGILLSSSLAAGFFGPPILGYLADHYGRKRVIVAGAFTFGLFSLAAVATTSLDELVLTRILAGIALAGTMPTVVSLVNEFAPKQARATMVVLMFTGVTFGGGLPGLIAAKFMAAHGWRILFWVGGLSPLAIAAVLLFALPESVKYLTLHPARRDELISLLQRVDSSLQIGSDTRFVISSEQNKPHFKFGALLQGPLAVLTPLYWTSNLVALMVFYFINQWMPTVLSTSGVSLEQAAIATTLFQFGGTLAGLLSMRLLDRYGFLPVPILFACAIPIVIGIGVPGLGPAARIGLVASAGFCLLGLQFGNIATGANIYPTYIRSWGVGSNFAVARIGGALGPLVGGMAFGAHLPPQQIFTIAAAPLVVGLIAALLIVPRYRAQLQHQHGDAEASRLFQPI